MDHAPIFIASDDQMPNFRAEAESCLYDRNSFRTITRSGKGNPEVGFSREDEIIKVSQ
jgi:hypothetical protein